MYLTLRAFKRMKTCSGSKNDITNATGHFKVIGKGLKRKSKLRKASKEPISRLQKKIWELCKQITRKRYGNSCYTCGRRGLEGSNWQTGHMWAKASVGAYLKYDLRILRPQCSVCNLFQGGRGADFYKRMLREIGPEKMSGLESDRQKIIGAYDHYLKILADYQRIYEEDNRTGNGAIELGSS